MRPLASRPHAPRRSPPRPIIPVRMSIFDRRRLPPAVFKLDVERMRQGWYSDKYFINIARTLAELAAPGLPLRRHGPRPLATSTSTSRSVDVGSIEVEMQWFPRRQPSCVVVGVDKALAMLRECTGYFDDAGRFVNTFDADGGLGRPRRQRGALRRRPAERDAR